MKKPAKARKAYKPLPPPKKAKTKMVEPLWDLYRDGISYSLLSKFLICRERFRLGAVEGWTESGIHAGLEFGNAFHLCLEKDEAPFKVTSQYQKSKQENSSLLPHQLKEFEQLMCAVEATVKGYKKHWKTEDRNFTSVAREKVFEIPYSVPFHGGQRSVTLKLRGKIDEVLRYKKSKRLWVFETKTKSDIDSDGLHRTLAQDLQTMLYCTAAHHLYKESPEGVLYNVIRRPGLRLGKTESLVNYRNRIEADVQKRAEWYFHRWEVKLDPDDLEKWQIRSLNPLLRQIIQWWESIKNNPFDPWDSEYHFQRPFGVYDGLASGRRGDFFNLLTSGSYKGLEAKSTVFPELEEV